MNSAGDELQSALERAEGLQKALERRERQITALRRVSEALSFAGGETLIGQAMDVALQALGARAGAVLLYDAQDDTLIFRCVLGPQAQCLTGTRISASEGVAGQVLRTGWPDITQHAAQHEGFHLLRSDETQNHAQKSETLLTVPLRRASGSALGVMQLVWTHAEAHGDTDFDRGDLEVVQVLGAGIVATLETARLAGQERRAEIVSIIGDISHDIKNMLTPIQSGLWTLEPMLDELCEGLQTVQEQMQGRAAHGQIARIIELVAGNYGWILQSAHDSCDQVKARTREIADAVKGELAAPVFEVGDLNEVALAVGRPLFLLAEQTNVQLHFDLDNDLPRAEFDRKQLYSALYNLVSNAIPETPSGGGITVRTRAPAPGEDTILCEVEDTGGGVPEHVRVRLFTDQAISTKPGGTGLGTRIVGGVVRRHGGSIAVKSEIGVGSTFSIRLPLRQRIAVEPNSAPSGPLPTRRHNLPVSTTSFVGRAGERSKAREMLQGGVRLLTLSGAAGTGKTRLALQVAADLVNEFEDGVWLVSLAPIENADRVVAAIAATLGVRGEPGRELQSSLADFLRPKRLLLVLDNFEQVFSAAPLVAALLEACEGVKILATSRFLLRLRGERELSVAPLELPATASFPLHFSTAQVRDLVACEAVALFAERAAQVRPDFEISPANARDVALICTRLDGLPLAIELAAARIKILSPGALRTHLENHLPLPGSGPQDAPRRHQTLRAALDWSYDLLSPAEQVLLRRLMVFEGGCSPEAARAVTATDVTATDVAATDEIEAEIDIWRGLELLCDKSLLRGAPQSDGSTWFFALETLRQYGHEKMVENGELEAVQRRHAAYYLSLAEGAHALLLKSEGAPPAPPGLPAPDASQRLWRDWREREHENLRAALRWFLENPRPENLAAAGQPIPAHGALRMALALREVWVGNLWTERREALERALEENPDAPPRDRLHAMLYAGDLAALQGDHARADEFGQRSFDLSREMGSDWGTARALGILGNSALEKGDFARARTLLQQSLALYRANGNGSSVPWALYFLGAAAKQAGDATASRDSFEQSLAAFRELEDKEGIAMALYQLGMALYRRDDPAPARAMIEESLAAFTELSHQSGTGWTLAFLGRIAADAGDFAAARARLGQSLEVARRLGSRADVRLLLLSLSEVALQEADWEEARIYLRELLGEITDKNSLPPREVLLAFARLAAGQGQCARAAQLWGAAHQFAPGDTPGAAPNDAPGAIDSGALMQTRASLGEAAWQTAWEKGRALTPEAAKQEVLKV